MGPAVVPVSGVFPGVAPVGSLNASLISPLSGISSALVVPSVPVLPAAASFSSEASGVAPVAAAARAVATIPVRSVAIRSISAVVAPIVPTHSAAAERVEHQDSVGRDLFDGEVRRKDDGAVVPVVAATHLPALSESVRPRKSESKPAAEDKPYSWPKPARWLVLGSLLTLLSWAPPLLHAATQAPFAPMNLGLGAFSDFGSWPLLIAVGVAAGVAGIPLRNFAHRLAPWTMKSKKNPTDGMVEKSLALIVPQIAFAAAVEEVAFRGLIFPMAASLLMAVLSPYAALAAAGFAAALGFAAIHGYGPVWTRVVGALLYTVALVASGTLLLPIVMHFAFNMTLLLRERFKKTA